MKYMYYDDYKKFLKTGELPIKYPRMLFPDTPWLYQKIKKQKKQHFRNLARNRKVSELGKEF